MTEPILRVTNLVKHFGGVVATDHLNLDVLRGEIHAVIGPNGAGKTTLVAQLAGMLTPDAGSIHFDGVDITHASTAVRSHRGLSRSFQITSIFPNFTALANVALALQAHAGHSFRFWRPVHKDPAWTEPARALLDRVDLKDHVDTLAAHLAHGAQRQLDIAMAMATHPKLLLLDEPTAGMGPEDSARLTHFLARLKGDYAILLIEHDMDTVFRLADRLTVLVSGRRIATGSPQDIRHHEEVRAAYLGEEE
ncbi:Lipopolysaccharide export system ATP-binding protein LptB [Candidatus Entotheonellaceae bacterium PAL068K]